MTTTHNLKLGLSGISLTKARTNRYGIQALGVVQDRLEPVLVESGFFEGAPFSWVSISLLYGLHDANEPVYHPINKKFGDLPLSIELDTHRIIGKVSLDELIEPFTRATLIALVQAGKRYGRPVERLERMLARD